MAAACYRSKGWPQPACPLLRRVQPSSLPPPPYRHKGLCLKRATEAGVATARLPIQKYVKLDSRAVLTVNHVVQIMAEYFSK